MVLQYTGEGWELVCLPEPLDPPTASLGGRQQVVIALPEAPVAGMTLERPIRHGDGYWTRPEPGVAGQALTNWYGTFSAALTLTRLELSPFDPQQPVPQPAGHIDGRLLVCYQRSGAFPAGVIAGEYSGGLVRYLAPPVDH